MIPVDSLLQLRRRLDRLPPKSPERADRVAAVAELYGVSATTVYRALRTFQKPRAAQRADHGKPRVLPATELERYCEVIAALKLRTRNKQGRHLSTRRAIELLEHYGVETAQGLVRAPSGVLHKTTVNLYLRRWHLDQPRLLRQPPAVRFQAESSNACWQFDLSPSDLKQVEAPLWIEPARGRPTLMLFSVVDDRSGVSYQEYRCVYPNCAKSLALMIFKNIIRYTTVAHAYAPTGASEQARAVRRSKSNTLTRIVGALNALTGGVFHGRASTITIGFLVVFYQALCRAYPDAERIYVIQDNGPVHTHPDLLVALEPQETRWPWYRPPSWPTEPSPAATRRWGALQ